MMIIMAVQIFPMMHRSQEVFSMFVDVFKLGHRYLIDLYRKSQNTKITGETELYQESACFHWFWLYNKIITMYVPLLWYIKFILLIAGATDVKVFPKYSYFLDILWNINTYMTNILSIFVYNLYVFISYVAIIIVVKLSILSI